MKDCNGKTIAVGNEVVIKAAGKEIYGIVSEVAEDKIYFDLGDGKKGKLSENAVKQRISIVEETDNYIDTKSLLAEALKSTNPNYNIENDGLPEISMEALKHAGIGTDKNHMRMGLTEEQVRGSKYGKIYSLLKEAFDLAVENDELIEVARTISNAASDLKAQI